MSEAMDNWEFKCGVLQHEIREFKAEIKLLRAVAKKTQRMLLAIPRDYYEWTEPVETALQDWRGGSGE